jgi:cytochrome c biogenesis protein
MNAETKIKVNFLESLWIFFASIRLTVTVLLSLAALSIIGTLIPQNQNPADYLKAFGPFIFQLFLVLDIYDMYHAWWFQSLILILTINIIVCSIDRLQKTWPVLFPKARAFNLQSFRQRKSRLEINVNQSVDAVQAVFEKRLSRTFRHCRSERTDQGVAITAEKGRWTRLGVYGVHFSIVLLLIGALIGSIYGFEGYMNIPEGRTMDTIELRFSGVAHKLGFAVRCENFDVQFYQDSKRPKEFRSSLVIVENGRDILKKDIIVNDPLHYKGINIYQSSYGEIPPDQVQAASAENLPEEIEFNFQSKASGMIYSKKVALGKEVRLPEGLGRFVLGSYKREAEFGSMALGPAFSATLIPAEGPPQTILLPIKFPRFDAMRQGAVVVSVAEAGLSPAQTPGKRYYTGLQVAYDPGVGLVYAGFILMITGCVVAFFMSHQQVMVEVTSEDGGAHVLISGTANKNRAGFRLKLNRLAALPAPSDP